MFRIWSVLIDLKNDIILELQDIHKDFGEGEGKIHVLKGINLSIMPGEKLAVLGASGAGKSTLLHIMGTLETVKGTAQLYAAVTGDVKEVNDGFLSR
jgi:ABC-type lipoprotein export system ATPase subunit